MKTTSEIAYEHLRDQSIMPTLLSSSQLNALDANVRRKNFFSSRVYQAEFLTRAQKLTSDIADGVLDRATARALLKSELARIDYTAVPGQEGSIKDLRSDRRLNLIIDTNVEMARGYGAWLVSQSPAVLELYPAQELIRVGPMPAAPREWRRIWLASGGKFHKGLMMAHVQDGIWSRISRFGNPYPPYDYNSGMRLRGVRADNAEGVKQPVASEISADAQAFGGDVAVGGKGLSPELAQILREELGDEIQIDSAGMITYLSGALKWLYENTDENKTIRESREAFDLVEETARAVGQRKSTAENFYGVAAKDTIRQTYFAQASAVVVGRKQLFHDYFDEDQEDFLAEVFRLAWAKKHPHLRYHYEDGHMFLWRDDLLTITPQELLAMSQADATNGIMLGYGTPSADMSAPSVQIYDEDGVVWGGFKNGHEDWEKYAIERARDFSYATGKKFGYARQ